MSGWTGVSERDLYQGYGLQAVDEKGRVAIPSSLRGSVEANNPPGDDGKALRKLILSTHPRENCLIGYDLRYTASLAERLTARELANPEADGDIDYNIKRKGGGAAESLPFDASGRFILPPFPRFQAQIGAYAFFWGVLDFFEIWDPKTLIECDSATEVQKAAARFFMAERGIAL
jgi:MraZ protein